MSQRPHGKGVVRESEGLAGTSNVGERRRSGCHHGEKHVHLTNSIHIRRHLHLQSRVDAGGLMLDARRAAPQLPPLLREVTALQKIRTLQDPDTCSGSEGSSPGGRRGGWGITNSRKKAGLIGDPHRDAQALAVELSGRVAKATSSHTSDGASSRVSRPARISSNPRAGGGERRIRKSSRGNVEVPARVDVRDRVKRIEQAVQDASATNVSLSGELRKEGLIKQLKERGRIPRDREVSGEVGDDQRRWDGAAGPARREEIARRVIEERGSSISSLSQLLGNHYGSGRSAQALNLLDELAERHSSNRHHGEGSLFHTDDDDDDERSVTRSTTAAGLINPASPLHLASLSRSSKDQELIKRARHPRVRKTKPNSRSSGTRGGGGARPRGRSEIPVVDDELDVSELPAPRNGSSGVPMWDWSRMSHKHGAGKAFHDKGGGGGLDAAAMTAEATQSISSLDSDANALPLIIGEDAHDSDFAAGYSIETTGGSAREVVLPQKLATSTKRKASLQNAVKDVPERGRDAGAAATPPPPPARDHAPRTLTQKYRPKSFREIVGQSVVVKSLSTAIVKGKVAPVYLFMGPRGTGKTSAARVFAAGLNCESLDYTRRPCGNCRECATMTNLNRSADVREIDAAATADLTTLRATMGSFTPVGRNYKIFIVEGCESLTADIWNAFLKVLEEPPPNVVFILITTDADQIPPTATSRCQKFHFSKLKESDIVTRLETLARQEGLGVVEEGALALIASRSDGSLRDAEIVLDQVCLLEKNVSIALVRELVGLLPDGLILDLLDFALSADTTNTVRTLRELLASGVEPLSLVSQLGTLIADILAGSYNVRRETRGQETFFNRNFSVREEQHRLRQALKILSESEKQLRGTSDRAPWLTAALLQFAPDRSFLPSEAGDSVAAHSPLGAPRSGGSHDHPRLHSRNRGSDLPSMDEPEYQTQQLGSSSMDLQERQSLNAYVETSPRIRRDDAAASSLSEQKLEEAWAREAPHHQHQVATASATADADGGETSEGGGVRHAPSEPESLEFQVYGEEALAELWNRVLWEITSRSLKHLLQTHGRLVGAGVAVDGSCAVVELDFDHPRDKHRAERSWRSICIAFQAVLSTAVELRIALSDVLHDQEAESAAARVGETVTDMQAGPSSTPPKVISTGEIVTEDSNGDYSIHPVTHKQKEIAHDDNDDLKDQIPHSSRAGGHHRRSRAGRKHRHHATDQAVDQRHHSPGGITPRRLPPSRRRKGRRNAKGPSKTVVTLPVRDMTRLSSLESSSFGGGEVWDSGPQLIVLDRPSREKKLLSTMMEEPQSDIEDIRSARKKIWAQRSARGESFSQPASLNRRTSTVNGQRGLPRESLRCWKMASPRPEFLMRKSRVKGVRRARGKALFLSMVPCSHSRSNARNGPPAPTVASIT